MTKNVRGVKKLYPISLNFSETTAQGFHKKKTELYQKRDAGTSDKYVLNLECPCTLSQVFSSEFCEI